MALEEWTDMDKTISLHLWWGIIKVLKGWILHPFDSNLVKSGRWVGDNERLCNGTLFTIEKIQGGGGGGGGGRHPQSFGRGGNISFAPPPPNNPPAFSFNFYVKQEKITNVPS